MNNTAEHQPLTQTEIEAIHRIEADQDWHNDAQSRTAHADALLEQIAHDIDVVPPHSREHAADLLDAAIELLQRTSRRFSPLSPESTAQEPPF